MYSTNLALILKCYYLCGPVTCSFFNSLLVGLGFDTSLMMRSIPLRGFDQVSTFIIGSKPHCIKDERYQTVSAKSPWFVNFNSKATSKWRTHALSTRQMPYRSLPVNNFGYRPQIIFRGVGSRISQFSFKGPVDSLTPRWNISKYLPTTTSGLTKNLKNF